MAVSVTGIVINIIMVILIAITAIFGFSYNSELRTCETKQSTFCHVIQCQCDDQSQAPCFGYAKQPAEKEGQWYCSNAPRTAVDDNGKIV